MTQLTNKTLEAQIFHLNAWTNLTKPTALKERIEASLYKAGFHILGFTDQHFPTEGYTAFWLLAESHLAIHTFPNKACSYIELSSCNQAKALLCQELLNADFTLNIQWSTALEKRTPDKLSL